MYTVDSNQNTVYGHNNSRPVNEGESVNGTGCTAEAWAVNSPIGIIAYGAGAVSIEFKNVKGGFTYGRHESG